MAGESVTRGPSTTTLSGLPALSGLQQQGSGTWSPPASLAYLRKRGNKPLTPKWKVYLALAFRSPQYLLVLAILLSGFAGFAGFAASRATVASPPPPPPLLKPGQGQSEKAEALRVVKEEVKTAQQAGQVAKFREHAPLFSFVLYRTHRVSAVKFAAVGLGGLALKDTRKLGRCLWKEKDGGHRVTGNITALYPGEHHNLRYEAIVLVCHLEESTDQDYGGVLLMTVDKVDMVVYVEEKGAYSMGNPRPPFKYQLAMCSPPLVDQLPPRRVYEWLEYAFYQGVDRVVLYDAGAVTSEVMAVVEPYAEQGLVEVVDVRGLKGYEAWDSGRLLAINDCTYHLQYKAKWALFTDLSEYFSAANGEKLLAVLNRHQGKPYITLGSSWWSVEKCVKQVSSSSSVTEGEEQKQQQEGGEEEQAAVTWGIEEMLFRWPHIYCTDKEEYPKPELCLDYHGFRRFAIDPRQVSAVQIHKTVLPGSGGFDLDADEAHLNRFHGLLDPKSKVCSKKMSNSESVDWWVKDTQLALVAREVQQQPKARFRSRPGG